HHRAAAGMQRRMGLQDEARRAPRFAAPEVVDADAGGGAEGLPIAQARLHLGMARARPQAVALEPDHRAGIAQFLVKWIGLGEEIVGEGIDRGDRKRGRHRHARGGRRRSWNQARYFSIFACCADGAWRRHVAPSSLLAGAPQRSSTQSLGLYAISRSGARSITSLSTRVHCEPSV